MGRRFSGGLNFILAVLLIVIVALTYRQAFSAGISAHPGNRRVLIGESSVQRGSIFAADGAVLAESRRRNNGVYRRVYPQGKIFAAVTGYYSPTRGRAGLEAEQTDWLAARRHFRSIDDWLNSMMNKPRRGYDVSVSIIPRIQREAWRLLGDRGGAVVALDPKTGAIVAFVSRPTFDPNLIDDRWSEITAADGLLINRASQGLYPPGSTFKVVTAASALESGVAAPDSVYDGPAVLPVYGGKVTNFANRDVGKMTLARAFAKSTNTIFARIGLEVGANGLTATARNFGLNSRPPIDTDAANSTIPNPASMDKLMLAWTAVGQGKTLTTPLQMALIASAIANDGRAYRPFLTDVVRDYTGLVRYKTKPQLWLTATDAETARKIKAMMVETVRSGTGQAAALSDITIAGKTGTAELGPKTAPDAWFIGFGPAEDPKIALAVLVENGGLGGQTAAPIAREIFKKALR